VRIRKLLAVCGILAVPLLGTAATASASDDPRGGGGWDHGCYSVLTGPSSGSLTKSGPTNVVHNPDGSYTLTYSFTTNRPDGTYQVQDCAFIDDNGSGAYDNHDRVVGHTNQQVTVTGGHGSFPLTVSPANLNCLCDRMTLAGAGFTDKSDVLCPDHGPGGGPIGAAGFGLLAAGPLPKTVVPRLLRSAPGPVADGTAYGGRRVLPRSFRVVDAAPVTTTDPTPITLRGSRCRPDAFPARAATRGW
jgi:hypothetical protein